MNNVSFSYKKLSSVKMALVLLASLVFADQALAIEKIDGVYQIQTCADLNDFAAAVNGGENTADAILLNDIGPSCELATPIGKHVLTIENFQYVPQGVQYKGTFNGNNKTITGFKVGGALYYAGMFGYLGEGAVVKNLTLADVDISTTMAGILMKVYIGGITAYNDGGLIQNCTVTGMGSVSGTIESKESGFAQMGGIVGYQKAGTVDHCTSNVSITNSANGVFNLDEDYGGGLIGYMASGVLSNSAFEGETIKTRRPNGAGALVGYARAGAIIDGCGAPNYDGDDVGDGYDGVVYQLNVVYKNNGKQVDVKQYKMAKDSVYNIEASKFGYTSFNPEAVTGKKKAETETVTVTCVLENYTITYDLDGGSNPSGAATSYTIESEEIVLPTPTKAGYNFEGWFDNAEKTGIPETKILARSSGNKKFWAKWSIEEYSITYSNMDGAVNNSDNPVKYTVLDNVVLQDASKEGFKFEGWFEKSDFSIDAVTGFAAGSTGDKEVWAKWTPYIVITAANQEYVYTGSAQGVAVTTDAEAATVQYSVDGGETWSESAPQLTDAGSVNVSVKASAEGYAPAEAQYTISVAQATTNNVTVTMKGWTYGGAVQDPSAVADFGSASFEYSKKDADEWSETKPSAAGVYTVKATVTGIDNYVGGSAMADFTIAPKAVPAVTFSFDKPRYNGKMQKPEVIVKDGDVALVEGVDFTVSWDKDGFVNAGKYKATASGIGNYTGTAAKIYEIQQKEVTCGVRDTSKVYDGKPLVPTGFCTGLVEGEEGAPSVTGSIVEVGRLVYTYKTIWETSTSTSANYFIASNHYGTVEVKPKAVTVAAVDAGKIFGEEDPALTADVTGLVEGESEDLIKFEVARVEGENVGEYVITAAGESTQGNYAVAFENAKFTVAAASFSVAGTDYNDIYDGTAHGAAAVASVTEGTTIQYSVDGGETWSEDFPTITDVGTVSVNVKATNFNYVDATDTYALTIVPKAVTVAAVDAGKIFGEEDPALTADVTGLVEGESEDLIKFEVARVEGENVGEYVITAAGESTQGNYAVAFENAKFTVAPKAVTVAAVDAGKTYGEEDPALTANVTGLVDGESEDLIQFEVARVEGENVGEYVITAAGESTQGNYTVAFENAKFTVNPVMTFVMNGYGEPVESQKVLLNGKAVKPADPVATDYNFNGWFIDDATFENEFDFETPLTDNMTVYAKWTVKTKDIVVVYGDGEDDEITVTVDVTDTEEEIEKKIEEALADADIPTPTKEDTEDSTYTFNKFEENEETGKYEPTFDAEVKTEEIIVVYGDEPGEEIVVVINVTDTEEEIEKKIEDALAAADIPIPTKDRDDQYEYTFDKFEKNEETGKYEPTFIATPYEKEIEVAVGDIDGDGETDVIEVTILSTDDEEEIEKKIEEALADADIPTPTKDEDDVYTYEFDKFVKNDSTGVYEAEFIANGKTFLVKFIMPKNAELVEKFDGYVYGRTTILPEARIKDDASWTFNGWFSKADGMGSRVKSIAPGEVGDKVVYGWFQKNINYKVRDEKGSLVVSFSEDMDKAIKNALASVKTEDYVEDGVTYTFDKWELEKDVYVAKFAQATGLKVVASAPRFNVSVSGRTLQIEGAKIGAKVAVFDMRGRLVANSVVENGTQLVDLAKAGTYVVRVNNQTARVQVR